MTRRYINKGRNRSRLLVGREWSSYIIYDLLNVTCCLGPNRIPITQYHTNSVYSRSAIISVLALLLTNQLPITLYCTPTSAKSVIGG